MTELSWCHVSAGLDGYAVSNTELELRGTFLYNKLSWEKKVDLFMDLIFLEPQNNLM